MKKKSHILITDPQTKNNCNRGPQPFERPVQKLLRVEGGGWSGEDLNQFYSRETSRFLIN